MDFTLKTTFVWRIVMLGLLAQLAASSASVNVSVSVVTSPSGAMMCPAGGAHFSYDNGSPDGPSSWDTLSPCCGGSRQSPRNILTIDSLTVCGLQFSQFSYQGQTTVTGQLLNNGHSPTLNIATGTTTARMVGAPYTHDPYVLANIHLHFYNSGGHGSEHAVDYRYYDAEVHLVHYKEEYGSVGSALMNEDGLLVIGLFLEVSNGSPNDEIVKLIDAIKNVQGIGDAGAVTHDVDLTQLLPANQDLYTYAGSLTTPPCAESVRWVVMKEPLKINSNQIDILTQLESTDGGLISDHSNDRPVQNGNTKVRTNYFCLG